MLAAALKIGSYASKRLASDLVVLYKRSPQEPMAQCRISTSRHVTLFIVSDALIVTTVEQTIHSEAPVFLKKDCNRLQVGGIAISNNPCCCKAGHEFLVQVGAQQCIALQGTSGRYTITRTQRLKNELEPPHTGWIKSTPCESSFVPRDIIEKPLNVLLLNDLIDPFLEFFSVFCRPAWFLASHAQEYNRKSMHVCSL
jgi:hypothetical protein